MARGSLPRASEALAEQIRATATAQGTTRIVVLIDGHSGSGKTTLAAEVAYLLKAQHVGLDAFYPGWGGLEVGSAMVPGVLDPSTSAYVRWDWKRNQAAERHKVNSKRDIVVEGSGCMSRANRDLATYGIWIRLDQAERKRRALARDGASLHGNWDRWAAQEQAFFARERPDTLADAIMDGRSGELLFSANPNSVQE